jgi:hypothetical protein
MQLISILQLALPVPQINRDSSWYWMRFFIDCVPRHHIPSYNQYPRRCEVAADRRWCPLTQWRRTTEGHNPTMGLCMIIRGGKRPLRGCLAKDKHYHKTGRDFCEECHERCICEGPRKPTAIKTVGLIQICYCEVFYGTPLIAFSKTIA